jgi:hypothetical protein
MNKQNDDLSVENVYNHFSILLFSTLFIIIAYILSIYVIRYSYMKYISIGFFILSFIGYYFLVISSTTHYLQKTFNMFKTSYRKHKLKYWLAFGILMILLLVLMAYIKLDTQNFWNTLITTGYILFITFIGWVAKRIYNLRKKKR